MGIMIAVAGVFLGPFAIAYIYNALLIKKMDQEERRLAKMDEEEV